MESILLLDPPPTKHPQKGDGDGVGNVGEKERGSALRGSPDGEVSVETRDLLPFPLHQKGRFRPADLGVGRESMGSMPLSKPGKDSWVLPVPKRSLQTRTIN